ncbi:phospholipase D/transphosphatidylase [Salinisphaera dokdonensis CL-ES53]|uniref:Phospholipase D/transphosphatidylase n=1 Tax=Salinisphaera dokdonensis CL-ES53 TaxID=1304272 RepID=A0ABV2B1K8_9GAMM
MNLPDYLTAPELLSLLRFWATVIVLAGSALVASVHALLTRETPASAFGWIGVSVLFPPVGPLLYYMFGVNRVRIRARRLDRQSRHGLGARQPGAYAELRDYSEVLDRRRLGLAAAGDRLSAWPVVAGNGVDMLHNGEQAYPPMLEAIEKAHRFVYLTTYIFETNKVGKRFIDALGRAAERGVDVRVLIDGVGEYYAWPGRRAVALLKRQNVQAARFLPPRLLPPSLRINLRNHRKILVTDAGVAFTGGMNIGDRHFYADGRGVEDMHFRFAGPIVRQIEAVFLSDWAFATGRQTGVSRGEIAPAGSAACRSIENGPTRDTERLATLVQTAVASARRRVLIMTPYFLPGPALIGALQSAALRGLDVQIVLPSKNNLPFVEWASRHALGELMLRGVKIHYRPPPFAHTKLLVLDDDYALVGSPNLDPRSLRLNFELAVEIFDPAGVERLARHIENVLERSRAYTLADLRRRRWPARMRDSIFWLFSSYF